MLDTQPSIQREIQPEKGNNPKFVLATRLEPTTPVFCSCKAAPLPLTVGSSRTDWSNSVTCQVLVPTVTEKPGVWLKVTMEVFKRGVEVALRAVL